MINLLDLDIAYKQLASARTILDTFRPVLIRHDPTWDTCWDERKIKGGRWRGCKTQAQWDEHRRRRGARRERRRLHREGQQRQEK